MSTQITINPDKTLACKWTGPKSRGSLFQLAAAGNVEMVNQLDTNELLAVVVSVKVAAFPCGKGEEVYRKVLDTLQTDPTKIFPNGTPTIDLGELRKAVVHKAGEGFNAPHDSYLRIAVAVKKGETPDRY